MPSLTGALLRTAVVFQTVVIAFVAAGCGGDGGKARVTAEAVFKKCNQYSYLQLSADKKAIEYPFQPGNEMTEAIYNCLLKESGAPSSVDFRVKETRPVDGTQTAKWDGWEMSWNYDAGSRVCRLHLSEA